MMLGLHIELTKKTDETQVNLYAVNMSLDTQTKSCLNTITDIREHLH
jgi:hypothetical protein